MHAPVSGRGGTFWWRFAPVLFVPLLCVLGCNKNPTTTPGVFQGSLDSVDVDAIRGWAWDDSRPDAPIDVDLYDGDTKLKTVTADQFRPDLLDNKVGNGKHAFTYPTPDSLKDGQPHTIRAKAVGASQELDGSPKQFKDR